MKLQYVEITFENTNENETGAILESLMCNSKWQHITGQSGSLVGYIQQEADLQEFKKIASDIVWKHNDGMFCEVTPVTEKDINHLL